MVNLHKRMYVRESRPGAPDPVELAALLEAAAIGVYTAYAASHPDLALVDILDTALILQERTGEQLTELTEILADRDG